MNRRKLLGLLAMTPLAGLVPKLEGSVTPPSLSPAKPAQLFLSPRWTKQENLLPAVMDIVYPRIKDCAVNRILWPDARDFKTRYLEYQREGGLYFPVGNPISKPDEQHFIEATKKNRLIIPHFEISSCPVIPKEMSNEVHIRKFELAAKAMNSEKIAYMLSLFEILARAEYSSPHYKANPEIQADILFEEPIISGVKALNARGIRVGHVLFNPEETEGLILRSTLIDVETDPYLISIGVVGYMKGLVLWGLPQVKTGEAWVFGHGNSPKLASGIYQHGRIEVGVKEGEKDAFWHIREEIGFLISPTGVQKISFKHTAKGATVAGDHKRLGCDFGQSPESVWLSKIAPAGKHYTLQYLENVTCA